METYIDVAFHIIFSLAVGFLVWSVYFPKDKKLLGWNLLAALTSGLFIDVDHLFDYFFVYGLHFDFNRFIHNTEFAVSGKNYVLFHGYEYVIILGVIAYFAKGKFKKMVFTTMAISMAFHLAIDIMLASIPLQYYSLIYRILTNFNTKSF